MNVESDDAAGSAHYSVPHERREDAADDAEQAIVIREYTPERDRTCPPHRRSPPNGYMAAYNSPNPDRGAAQFETDDRDAQRLIEIDDDGTIHGEVSPEIREKFADHEMFSAVYYGGCIVLQGVK